MIILAKNKKTDYRIIIAADAAPSVIHGAEELKRFLGEISGADFIIDTDRSKQTESEILVGRSSHFDALDTGICLRCLGDEGLYLKTVGKTVVIAGSDVRGAMYGVYQLLDEYLGCRWFTEDVSFIPKLEYRDPYFYGYYDGDWFARNRMNAKSASLTPLMGGKVDYHRFVHSMSELIPQEEYGDSHPEYYCLRYKDDGTSERLSHSYSQPCLTNPEVLEIAKKNVRKILDENPNCQIMSVSQNDNYLFCQCDACKAVDEEEGSHAGTLIRFVNAIAEDIEKDYPNVAIDTLAYQYTRKPPKHVVPRPNVIVRLCSIECCFGHPLDECSLSGTEGGQGSFTDDLVGWGKICKRLHIWDYVVNFAHTLSPFPNFKVLRPNIRYFIEHGVTGIFEEGNNSVRETGELNLLRQYCLAKYLWDPDYDEDKAVNEFLTGYYGHAAASVRAYFNLIHDQITPDVHVHIYDSPHQPYMRAEVLDAADKIFDEAESAADCDTILQRVKTLRLSVRYARLCNTPADDPKRAAEAERFIADVRAAGINSYREGTRIPQVEDKIREGSI